MFVEDLPANNKNTKHLKRERDLAMTITDNFSVFASRYHPSPSTRGRPLGDLRSVAWCGKHVRFAEEPSQSLTFCGLNQGDIAEPKNRLKGFLPHQFVVRMTHVGGGHRWDTTCSGSFCSNCVRVKINRVTERWECLGHSAH